MTRRPFRFGVVAARARSGDEWSAKARRVEQLGYATLLVPDRLGPLLSPMPALAVAAAATRSLRVGAFVLVSSWRNPVLLARECATLDFLSGGRFELGLGAGVAEEDFRQAGLPFDRPGARVDQLAGALATLKALLGDQPAPAAGGPSTPTGPPSYPPPMQHPRLPILVAGSGRRLLGLAAREADIVSLGTGQDGLTERAIADRIDWLRQAAGERFPHVEINLNLLAVLDGGPPEPRVLERIRAIHGADLDQLVAARSPFIVTGSPDQMAEQVVERRDRFGISYVTVADDMMEAFAPVVARLAGR